MMSSLSAAVLALLAVIAPDGLVWANETRTVGEARVIDGDTLEVGPVRIRPPEDALDSAPILKVLDPSLARRRSGR